MTDLKNKLATKANAGAIEKGDKPKTIKQWIVAMEPEIKKALPSVITPERFTRMALTAVSSSPKLAECTPQSFMGALMQCSQLGLEPNTPLGQAYLLPYKNKGIMEASFQMGYKGLIDLAHRSGEFKMIDAQEVFENDTFEYSYGLEPSLKHIPTLKNRGNVIAYYAVYTLINGGHGFKVMSKEDVQKHMKFSPSVKQGRTSPWDTNFDEMAKKTVLKKVLKYAPIKTDFARNIAQDETVKKELDKDMTEVEGYSPFSDGEIIEAEYKDFEPETEIPEID